MITLASAVQLFLSARIGIVSAKTLRINRTYLASLVNFWEADRMLDTLTLQHLRTWRASLFARDRKYGAGTVRPAEQGKLSVHTVHGMVRTVKQFFRWVCDEGLLKENLAARLELPPLPKGPPKHIASGDAMRMFEAARDSARDTALLHFLFDTGCRLGGAARLKLRELDLEAGRAIVWEKGRGGKGIARAVFLKPFAVAALRAWLDVRPAARGLDGKPVTDAVFVSDRHPHRGLSERGVYAVVRRLAKRAGIDGTTNPHAWRHGFAKRFLENGGSLGALSQLLGHSGVKVTHESYGVFVSRELQELHARYA